MHTKIKALIIDDSALIRNLVTKILTKSEQIEVVGTAVNGKFGLGKIDKLNPDIIILDIEMPEMNGLEFLKERRKRNITIPVIILSSLAKKGAKVTMEALALGASDFVLKPSEPGANIEDTGQQLIASIMGIAIPGIHNQYDICDGEEKKTPARTFLKVALNIPTAKYDDTSFSLQPIKSIPTIDIVTIGISTGGPNALRQVLPMFTKDFPVPIVIVQHMPAGFTHEFAQSLDKICPLEVKEAEDMDVIKKGRILIAPGDKHIIVERKTLANVIRLDDSAAVNGHKPSVSVLFESIAEIYKANTLACIMTGMGKDGADKIGSILKNGGITISQDKETSVVFGMPQVAIQNGYIQLVKPLHEIANTINNIVINKAI